MQNAGQDHTTWECPALQKQREAIITKECLGLQPEWLPVAVRNGIAPAMSPHPTLSYWGAKLDDVPVLMKNICGVGNKIVEFAEDGKKWSPG